VAALSITGPTVRMTAARISELCRVLVEESDRLSARLGYIEEGAHAA
jgi:DNA-binding IclR family transcriptional regulator